VSELDPLNFDPAGLETVEATQKKCNWGRQRKKGVNVAVVSVRELYMEHNVSPSSIHETSRYHHQRNVILRLEVAL